MSGIVRTTLLGDFGLVPGVRHLPDFALILGDLLEVRADSTAGLCVAVLDCGHKSPDLIVVPEDLEGDLRALEGKRVGICCVEGKYLVADFTGRCI